MFKFVKQLFSAKGKYRRIDVEKPFEFLLTESCVQSICKCIEPFTKKKHEGIAYIYGRTDGNITIAVGAIRPQARTTPGSFSVSVVEMARLVKEIRRCGLQLICQLHTHPGAAYHSEGDVEGLKLICSGYVSIVLPNYGIGLPSFNGAAFYYYKKGVGFCELNSEYIKIIPNTLP